MTSSATTPDDTLLQAAGLAFAMVRFQEASAHFRRSSTPPGAPRIGVDAYAFFPSLRRVPLAEVVPFLAALPSPAILIPSTSRGSVALILLDELSGDRRTGAEHELNNQQQGLEEMVRQAKLDPQASVLLDFESEANIFSLKAVRTWAERFAIDVGWSLGSLEDDPRASGRIMLYASDGRRSFGESLPPSSHPTPPDTR
jgi:hypothetical protein